MDDLTDGKDLTERLAALTPEQQELFRRRLREQGLSASAQAAAASAPVGGGEAGRRAEADADAEPPPPAPAESSAEMQFSLFFFSDDGSKDSDEKYRLLVEGARFADRNGFAAVWTPERHLQPFGGLYPNPSVLCAALAMITERVELRAGSVALPLHHPVRVAEEWSVVDNLSRGRVGVSFASGWHPLDFTLAPHAYAERKELLFNYLEIVQRLWAGETLQFEGVNDENVPVRLLPKPIQPSLPTWITISNNPETWERAGEIGANVLTALLRQPLDTLARKIALYRESRARHGHDPKAGLVTVMAHAFVGEDGASARETVRPVLGQYFRSNMKQLEVQTDLLAGTQGNGGSFDLSQLRAEDADTVAAYAFERYFETAMLCGSQAKCMRLVRQLCAIGVNEVACLIDFGLSHDTVIEGLGRLNELRESCARASAAAN